MSVDLPLGPLRLEAERGYADEAVQGGLGPFIQRWAAEASRTVTNEAARQAILRVGALFDGYAAATREQREKAVRAAREAIRALERAAPPSPTEPPSPLTLAASVTALRGISDRRAELLARLEIRTVGDLLRHYPFRYEDRRHVLPLSSVASGSNVVVCVEVTSPGQTIRRGRQQITTIPVADASGEGTLTWFSQPYRATQYAAGTRLLCCGVAKVIGGIPSIQVQECEVLSGAESLHMQRIVPIYHTTKGLSQPLLRFVVHQTIERTNHIAADPIPDSIRAERQLVPAADARRLIHFPDRPRQAEQARRRLAYEELFVLQVLLAMRRRLIHDAAQGTAIPVTDELAGEFRSSLPFDLTTAQERVLATVAADLRSDRPAIRLIHGDVGSGKTVIAAFSLLAAARPGHQAAFMAPTEILAEQHHRVLAELLSPFDLRPVLLTGSMSDQDKTRIRAGLAAGDIPIVIGTHALLQEGTEFAHLAVATVDEQHRFGVLQRAGLVAKGPRPHLFVMTATPIPRTLALVVYGDCDVSVLDELPRGRRPPLTRLLQIKDRDRAYQAVCEAVAKGQQAFVVCPLIEESEALEAEAAQKRHEELSSGALRDVRVELLHGRLRPDIRGQRIAAFRRGELDVLVTTTVIEVGVDVPAATIMVIENAERFGLAQLHQLRGRVGRGSEQGACYLVAATTRDDPAWERLQVLESTSDGFEVAREDLRMRGPGELTGTRQAGLPNLRIADLMADTALVEQAREDAFSLIAEDPALSAPEHADLRAVIHAAVPTLLPLMRAD